MSGTVLSNRIAKSNGLAAEAIVSAELGLSHTPYKMVDFDYDNLKLEVKSCQRVIKKLQKGGETRYGRYFLIGYQHQYLLDHNGFYLFFVDSTPLAVLPADSVCPSFDGIRQMSWQTIAAILDVGAWV